MFLPPRREFHDMTQPCEGPSVGLKGYAGGVAFGTTWHCRLILWLWPSQLPSREFCGQRMQRGMLQKGMMGARNPRFINLLEHL
jgi:hypothetical protein